jgi:very-short-patch-repair endonuclease
MTEERVTEFGTVLPRGSRELVKRARELRHDATSAEQVLWERLRGRKIAGRKFRRQHPVGRFVADFFCDDARLVIEVDGAIHQEPTQQERDATREYILRESTLTVLRFSNDHVLNRTDQVVQMITDFVATHTHEQSSTESIPSAPLLPQRRERGPGGEGKN